MKRINVHINHIQQQHIDLDLQMVLVWPDQQQRSCQWLVYHDASYDSVPEQRALAGCNSAPRA